MSRLGRLVLTTDGDGDVTVTVYPEVCHNGRAIIGPGQGVQFCVPGSGGGRSPRTHAALRALAAAMREDNADPACAIRAPAPDEIGGGKR